jgi:hypothetical protein
MITRGTVDRIGKFSSLLESVPVVITGRNR